jgi:selenocysteine lyase/cysteine desulfurase
MEKIRDQVIGLRTIFTSPFSFDLEALYADHTATNRPYQSIEKLIAYTKTLVANPHTEFSHFGKYSTQMMNYSQMSLLKTFNANP